jgi:hypothetical protein
MNIHDGDCVLVLVTVFTAKKPFGGTCDPVYSSSYTTTLSATVIGTQNIDCLPMSEVTRMFVERETEQCCTPFRNIGGKNVFTGYNRAEIVDGDIPRNFRKLLLLS